MAMIGMKSKSKILKNQNGNTSIRTKSNLDSSLNLPNENNLDTNNNKNGQ